MNGETETGLTTFFIDEKIDTGEIILNQKMQIGENETAGELHDRMMETGSDLVEKTIKAIENGTVKTRPQPSSDEQLKAAPKIFKEDCKIDWTEKGENIHNQIRGLSPYPAAYTFLVKEGEQNIHLKILSSRFEKEDHHHQIGKILSNGKNFLKVAVSNGYIDIREIQPAGKKVMKIKDFLNGFQDPEKWKMES
jgi:methionyl-tRNA formyltransferase